MIPNGIFARFRRRPSYEKHAGLVGSKEIREIGILAKPARSLFVPVRDFGAETIRLVRVEILKVLVFFFVDQYGVDVEGVVIVGGSGTLKRRRGGMKLGEEAMGFGELEGVEAVANVDEVLLRRAEFSGADGAAQDNDGEDEAEDRDLAMPESSVESSRPLSSQTLF